MKLLSLDGAAAAALSVRLLKQLENKRPGFLAQANVFAGTSDGALMALLLASRAGSDHEQNLKVIEECIDFSNACIPPYHFSLCDLLGFITGWRPLLQASHFQSVFQRYLGRGTIGDLKHRAIIVSFNASDWTSTLFTNMPPNARCDTTLVDAALASSALPLMVPIHFMPGGHTGYLDGGIVATNPTMSAVAYSCLTLEKGLSPMEQSHHPLVRLQLEHLQVVSMGAKESPAERNRISDGWLNRILHCLFDRPLPPGSGVDRGNGRWGWMQWLVLRPLLLSELGLQGSIEQVDFQCRQMLGDKQYLRIEPVMKEVMDLNELLLIPPEILIRQLDQQAAALATDECFWDPILDYVDHHWLAGPASPTEARAALTAT